MVSVNGGFRSPVPGQEVVELAHVVPVGHALKHVFEIGEGLDVIELGGCDEGGSVKFQFFGYCFNKLMSMSPLSHKSIHKRRPKPCVLAPFFCFHK